MAENIVELLTDLADAIREKKGTTEKINAQSFAEEIRSIESGGDDELISLLDGTATEFINDKITTLRGYAFYYSTNLKKIHLPNVTNSKGVSAFQRCTSLEDVYLPKFNISYNNTFYGCSALRQIVLPSTTKINPDTFNSCAMLAKLVLSNPTRCRLSNISAFTNTPIASGTGFIFVPDDLVESYKSATNWSTYADQIKGLSELPNE